MRLYRARSPTYSTHNSATTAANYRTAYYRTTYRWSTNRPAYEPTKWPDTTNRPVSSSGSSYIPERFQRFDLDVTFLIIQPLFQFATGVND